MRSRSTLAALVAGLATFVVVGAVVTELAYHPVEFSLFVGIPTGLLAGVVAASLVYRGLATDASEPRRRGSLALATSGAVFLVVLVLGATVVPIGTAISLVAGFVLGVLAGTRAYLW